VSTRPHLPAAALEGYLRHSVPTERQREIRAHLDNCDLCWATWNRHRWDAAADSPVYAHLVEFLGPRFRRYFDSSRALAAEWEAAGPRTDREIAQFFRGTDSYLYNLAIWEASGNRPEYVPLALPALAQHGVRTVLDYGCGIGSDSLLLQQKGLDVTGCDFRSPCTAFLRWRSHDTIPIVEPSELASVTAPDALWVLDTLDHLVDIDASLGVVLPHTGIVITENLTTCRGHGRQRFHIRRPFNELISVFARYGLVPIEDNPATAIMVWAR
jgi:hypothetical protein